MSQTRRAGRTRPHSLFLCTTLFLFSLSLFIVSASAQGHLVNGQFFTAGLAILDAPNPSSTQHAGSDLVIAIDLSGDGKIPQSAFIPGSGQATSYNSLELYLVSATENLNLTVSNGTGLLTQEPGSTVKHLNWPIPTCVPSGSYNLTIYEGANIRGQSFFSITPVTVQLENAQGSSAACTNGTNPLQAQPQPSSPPDFDFYGPVTYTYTISGSGMPTAWSIETSGMSQSINPSMTTVTVVVETPLAITVSGQATTTTLEIISTVTAAVPTSQISNGAFLPVNAGGRHHVPPILSLSFLLALTSFLLLGISIGQ